MYHEFAEQGQRILEFVQAKKNDDFVGKSSEDHDEPHRYDEVRALPHARPQISVPEELLEIDQPMEFDQLHDDGDDDEVDQMAKNIDPLPLTSGTDRPYQRRSSLFRSSGRYSGISDMFGGYNIPGEASALAIDWEALEEMDFDMGGGHDQFPARNQLAQQGSIQYQQEGGAPYAI
jgi:hypothetical protein